MRYDPVFFRLRDEYIEYPIRNYKEELRGKTVILKVYWETTPVTGWQVVNVGDVSGVVKMPKKPTTKNKGL